MSYNIIIILIMMLECDMGEGTGIGVIGILFLTFPLYRSDAAGRILLFRSLLVWEEE